METYRMHNQRSFDPMAAFLGGGDDVSAMTRFTSPNRGPCLKTFVLQVVGKATGKKEKSSSVQQQAVVALACRALLHRDTAIKRVCRVLAARTGATAAIQRRKSRRVHARADSALARAGFEIETAFGHAP
jgi:hypothetical protein